MRVAIVIESIEPRRGGAETGTVQFVQHLARCGCEVHVITASNAPSSPTATVHALPAQGATRRAKGDHFLRLAADAIRDETYDVVHSMLPIPGCDVYQPRGGTVAESIERNLALIRSGPLRHARRLANRLNLKQRSLLVQEAHLLQRHPETLVAAVSAYVADQLRRHYRVDESRIRIVFNGVDVPETIDAERERHRTELRDQLGLRGEELVLLMVAHNFRLKGVGRTIEAVAQLDTAGRPVKVLIVGRDNPARFRRQADRLGVADRIIFVGPSERVWAFYAAADVLVHPTYYDPCSRVVLEALASGLPAITTIYNGAAEVMADGIHGYVIGSGESVRRLTDAIRLLADDDHRRECGRNGRQLRERLSMRRHTEEMLAVYQEILQRGRRR